jgi:RNA polymerase sigma-70 factor (ECF subfamily)
MDATPATPPLAGLAEDEVVERAKRGGLEAFEELVERHGDRLYRMAVRLLRDEDDAKEAMQEGLLSAWRRLDQFEGKARFGSWLYRIVANAALMALRTKRRHPSVSLDEAGEEALDERGHELFESGRNWARMPDQQLATRELGEHIEAGIAELPESQRVVFLLRDVDEMDTREAALLLGISEESVKTRLHRARLHLRQVISAHFGE